ncbi:DUF6415 family natural product biosynthesis protein [Streptomyces chartreusis]
MPERTQQLPEQVELTGLLTFVETVDAELLPVEKWLLSAARDPRQAGWEWREGGLTFLRCGPLFTAIAAGRGIVTAPGIAPAETGEPIDAASIRSTYNSVRNGTTVESYEMLNSTIVGQIAVLMTLVSATVPRMQESSRKHVAEHVLRRARELVGTWPGVGARERDVHIFDLATVCRALLTLHENPGRLDQDGER